MGGGKNVWKDAGRATKRAIRMMDPQPQQLNWHRSDEQRNVIDPHIETVLITDTLYLH